MTLTQELAYIPLSALTAPERLRLSYPLRPDAYGEISARLPYFPLLAVNPAAEIVAGLDYFHFLLNTGTMGAWVLQAEYSDQQALFLNFNLKSMLTGVNVYEKLMFIARILPLAAPGDIYRETNLDIAINPSLTENLPVLLGEEFREPLTAGAITLKTALSLSRMEVADRGALLDVYARCPFSSSHQLKILEMAEELIFREKISLPDIFIRAGIPEILSRGAGSLPQKAIIEALFLLRNPVLAELERCWDEEIRNLHLPEQVKVAHFPNFEKRRMEATISVADMNTLRRLAEQLTRVLP